MRFRLWEKARRLSLGALLLASACEEDAVKVQEVPYPSNSSFAIDSRAHAPIPSASASTEPSPSPIAGLALVPTAKPSALWSSSFGPNTGPTLASAASPRPAVALRVLSAPPASAVAVAKPRCDPPYYYDASGTRVFKETCL
jgi:hypothetical protein